MNGEEDKMPPQQVCTLRIMLTVDSDEAAFELKKKVTAALSGLNVKVDFSITNMPQRPPMV